MIASSRRRGFAAAEFMVVIMVFGIGVLTLYSMFHKTSEEAFRSKWAYLAAHAARDKLEALRTMNLFGRNGTTPLAAQPWTPLAGSMIQDIDYHGFSTRPEYEYPPEYERIEVKVEIDGVPDERVLQITVKVRYRRKGAADEFGMATPDGEALPIGTFRTLIVNRERR